MTYLFSWSDTSNTIQQHAHIDIADNDTDSRYTDPYIHVTRFKRVPKELSPKVLQARASRPPRPPAIHRNAHETVASASRRHANALPQQPEHEGLLERARIRSLTTSAIHAPEPHGLNPPPPPSGHAPTRARARPPATSHART